MQLLDTWKRRWPWVFGTLYALSQLYSWFLDPIVRLNIERWAEARKADTLLVEGDKHVGAIVTWLGESSYAALSWTTAFFASKLFLGFAIGSILFAFWDPLTRYGNRYFRGKSSSLDIGGEEPSSAVTVVTKDNLRISYGVSVTNLSYTDDVKDIEVMLNTMQLHDGTVGTMGRRLFLLEAHESLFHLSPRQTKFVGLLSLWTPEAPPVGFKLEKWNLGPFVGIQATQGLFYSIYLPGEYIVDLSVSASGMQPNHTLLSLTVGENADVQLKKLPP